MSARDVAERLRKRRVVEEVQTKEGSLFVRGLTGRERSEYFGWLRGDTDGDILLSDHRLLAIALVTEDGAQLFETEAVALEVLKDWNHEDVTTAAKRALFLSGMGKDAKEAAEKKS